MSISDRAAFVDVESTGLSPWPVHEPWECALIVDGTEYLWQLPVDAGRADPKALEINGWWKRRWPQANTGDERHTALTGGVHNAVLTDAVVGAGFHVHPDDMGEWATLFARLTVGRGLVADNVGFDMRDHLTPLLRAHGVCPGFHHRGVDTESILYGWLCRSLQIDPSLEDKVPPAALTVPWSHGALLEAVNTVAGPILTVGDHTALGDARTVKAAFELAVGEVGA